MPFLVFTGIFAREISMQFFWAFLAFFLLQICLILIVLIWSKIFPLSKKENAIFRLNATVGNIVNFGLPLCIGIFGEESVAIISMFILATQLVLQTAGIFFISNGTKTPKESFFTIFKMPIFWAILLALFLQILHVKIPPLLYDTLKNFGKVAITLSVFIFGISLSHLKFSSFPVRLFFQSVLLRMFIAPFIALGIIKILPLEKIVANVFFVEATVPLGIYIVILSDVFDCDASHAASIVLASTILSIVSIPAWVILVL